MGQVMTISPIVTLTIAGPNGDTIKLTSLSEPITIQIPISHVGMCLDEMSAYSGKGTCMYWDEASMKYSADGCTTEHSDSAKYVMCRCNHLTSFVVDNSVEDEEVDPECSMCPAGKFQTEPCNTTVDAVCEECPSNSTSGPCSICPAGTYNAQARGACGACPNGPYQPDEGQNSIEGCTS